MGRPQINFFLAKDCLYRQDRGYERRTIKVVLTGNIAQFFVQQGTTSVKIWDISRISPISLKEMQDKFNEIKNNL